MARELGSDHKTLRYWVTKTRRERAAGPAALSSDERHELARLRRKVAELEVEVEILLQAAVVNACGQSMISRVKLMELSTLQKTAYGVRRLCRGLGVSKSAYYEHRRCEEALRQSMRPMRTRPIRRGPSTAACTRLDDSPPNCATASTLEPQKGCRR